jgi:hypothetical protein
VNAIERPATRGETLRCGFNQGIHLGSIKSGMSSIQFKIGFHYQDCYSTLFVYFNRRLWPTRATILGLYRPTSGTRTFSTRFAIRSCRRIGSRTSGDNLNKRPARKKDRTCANRATSHDAVGGLSELAIWAPNFCASSATALS